MAKPSLLLFSAVLACAASASSIATEPAKAKTLTSTFSSFVDEQNRQLSRIGDQLQTVISGFEKDEGQAKKEEAKNKMEMEDLEAQKEMALWAKWMLVATIVSSILTALSLFFVYLTLRHNSKSIEISSKSLTLSRENSERQLRAYVGVTMRDGFQQLLKTDHPYLDVRFFNAGATPALNLNYCLDVSAYPSENDGNYKYDENPKEISRNLNLMPGANQDAAFLIRNSLDGPATKVMQEQFRNGLINIYIDGHITYEDVYGHSRSTIFRFRIEHFASGMLAWETCNFGNSAT